MPIPYARPLSGGTYALSNGIFQLKVEVTFCVKMAAV